MRLLRWDQILDRLWLAASGAAALAIALNLGAEVGLRGWSSDGAVPTAQAAAPGLRPASNRPDRGCREAAGRPFP
jgi:hypothetical protein